MLNSLSMASYATVMIVPFIKEMNVAKMISPTTPHISNDGQFFGFPGLVGLSHVSTMVSGS